MRIFTSFITSLACRLILFAHVNKVVCVSADNNKLKWWYWWWW